MVPINWHIVNHQHISIPQKSINNHRVYKIQKHGCIIRPVMHPEVKWRSIWCNTTAADDCVGVAEVWVDYDGSSSPVSGQRQPIWLNSSCPLRCFSSANLILIVGNISINSVNSTAQSTLLGLSLSIGTLFSFRMLPLILLALKNHWQMVVLETNLPVSWYRPCLYAWRVHWLFSRRILARTRPSLSDIDIDPLPWVMIFNLVFGSTSNPSPSLLTILPAKLLDTFAALASAHELRVCYAGQP